MARSVFFFFIYARCNPMHGCSDMMVLLRQIGSLLSSNPNHSRMYRRLRAQLGTTARSEPGEEGK